MPWLSKGLLRRHFRLQGRSFHLAWKSSTDIESFFSSNFSAFSIFSTSHLSCRNLRTRRNCHTGRTLQLIAMTSRSALPSHLKPRIAGASGEAPDFARKHHGKTQSHVVSANFSCCTEVPSVADGGECDENTRINEQGLRHCRKGSRFLPL
jgi:hypothetical protein